MKTKIKLFSIISVSNLSKEFRFLSSGMKKGKEQKSPVGKITSKTVNGCKDFLYEPNDEELKSQSPR